MVNKNKREACRQLCTTDRTKRAISRATNLATNTVLKYEAKLKAANLDWPAIQKMSDEELNNILVSKRKPDPKKRLPDWAHVYKLMQTRYQTLYQIWHEYKLIDPGTAYSRSEFCKKYREFTKRIDVTMRLRHRAGETVFVDYAGTPINWTDPKTGEQRKAEVFVAVMGCSSYVFAWASDSQTKECWILAHVKLFEFLGGVPDVVVPDNLKSAVTKAGIIPNLNPTYLEMAQHYGTFIDPARVRRPQDKAHAEQGVLLVTRWITVPLNRRQFFSLDEVNEAIGELLHFVNQRPFTKLPGCRIEHFLELDKPALKPLPVAPYEYAEWVPEQKVDRDYHVKVKNHFYSVPHRFVGKKVEARVTSGMVEVTHSNQRIASHVRSRYEGQATTDAKHMPESHRKYANRNYSAYLSWANEVGPAVVEAVKNQFAGREEFSARACKCCDQLQHLGRLYGNEDLEAACSHAKALASLTVTSIKSILQSRVHESPTPPSPQLNIPLHENIRGADYYAQGVQTNA